MFAQARGGGGSGDERSEGFGMGCHTGLTDRAGGENEGPERVKDDHWSLAFGTGGWRY